MSDAARHRENLRGAIAGRAMAYLRIWEAIRKRHGEAEATAIMKEAIYARGCEIGQAFRHIDKKDMAGLRDAFLAYLPDPDMLQPEVHCSDAGLDIKFHDCPLKAAWQAAGLEGDELAKLCEIAGVVDNGTFEAAGFDFHAETWKPGQEGCCFIHVRPGD